MNHTLAIGVLFLLATSALAQDQSQKQAAAITPQTEQQIAAGAELNKAARAYMSGNFTKAQRHSELALEIDPSNKTAPSFIARSIHSQYRPGDESPENFALAREAIAAYQRLMLVRPEDEESFKAIAALYGALGENELEYAWILERALNGAVSVPKRAEAYVMLASKDWNCSFTITEGVENKQVARKRSGEGVIVYIKPKEQTDFDRAQLCTTRGMDMADTALVLDPENNLAWSFKSNLLLEMAKLFEMDGNKVRTNEYRRQAREAQTRADEYRRKQQMEEVAPEFRSTVTSGDSGRLSGSVIEGKAVSLPKPDYPAIARTARAQGEVVVQITIDEEGKVIDARALSGHPLLRAAAVAAARQASFLPTILSGQRVKVTGTIKFTFALPQEPDGDRPIPTQ